MSEQSFFQSALVNFTHEVASGGAIRHLTDLGYTVKQIMERLDFPTPEERVRRQVWERLLETDVILTEEPGSSHREKADYVREYDKYGRASFRRVVETTEDMSATHWRELKIDYRNQDKFRNVLTKEIAENGESASYVSCEFGLIARREPQLYQELLQELDERQREYVEGLPWEAKKVYHKLDSRMLEIVLRLSAKGLWQGQCYFLKTGYQTIYQNTI